MDNSKVRLCRKHMKNDGKGNRKPVKDLCRRSWWESGALQELLVELPGGEQNPVGDPRGGAEPWWSSWWRSGNLVELLVEKPKSGGAPKWSLHGA